jgi:hypothetical protein
MLNFRRASVSDRLARSRPRSSGRPAVRFLPQLDALEERRLLSNGLKVTNTNDSGSGSLRAAVAVAQSGDTIVFSHKIYGQTITLTSGPIEDTGISLSIQGPGADLVTVSGNNQSGIFNLQPSDPTQPPFAVSISGLTLASAAGPDTSPSYAINDTNASLTLNDVVIAGNMSGGVSVVNGYNTNPPPNYTINVTITNSTFQNNQSDQAGAALSVAGVVLQIGNCLFQDNVDTAQFYPFAIGGALYLTNTFFFGTIATIDNSQFIANTSVSDGGAIENFGGPLTIDSCTFTDNHSSAGGAIEDVWANAYFGLPLPTGAFNLTNSTFTDNQAIGLYAGFFNGADGGAINLTGINGPISIAGSTFVDNLAQGVAGGSGLGGDAAGGAIDAFFGSPNLFPPLPFTLAQSSFTGNLAVAGDGDTNGGLAQGGALRLGLVNATITGSQFNANSAVGGSGGSGDTFPFFNTLYQSAFGGAIEMTYEASIDDCTFSGNSAIGGNGGPGQIAGGGEGGALDNQFGALTLSDSTFKDNLAQGGQGGAATPGSSADGGAGSTGVGGAFANYDFLPFGSTANLTDLKFIGNQALGGTGGAGDGSGSGGVGGAAYGGAIINAGGLAVSSSKFVNNQALGGEGGAGGATGAGGNGGDGDGGGILSSGFGDPTSVSLDVTTSHFSANSAIGGTGGSGTTAVTDGQGLGGGIAILDGPATITKSKFSGNKASTSGNDIYGSYSS